ncbi:MAG: purine-nucleoside phosphorylase [Hyphomicrobiales bacterium]
MAGSGATSLTEWLSGHRARTAVILGSSLSGVGDALSDARAVRYGEIAGFPEPSVSGHGGRLVAGNLGGQPVVVFDGRVHYYETGRADAMRPVIQALGEAGVETLVLTNAAGSLDPDIKPGRLMMITDHINLAGANPLIGEPGDAGFVAMNDAYDPDLRASCAQAAADAGIALAQGVYCWFAGPSFETPAEIRAARMLGASAVGMSTVPETILARRFGLSVLGLSAITNFAAGIAGGAPDHGQTKAEGAKLTGALTRVLEGFVKGVYG